MEWSKIVEWFTGHILPFLTAANIALVVGLILKVVRQGRSIENNTGTAKELKETLKESKLVKEALKAVEEARDILSASFIDVKDEVQTLIAKNDAMLRVSEIIVNSLAKPTAETKETASNIVNNAVYTTTTARKRIADKANEMVKIDEEAARKKAEIAADIVDTANNRNVR